MTTRLAAASELACERMCPAESYRFGKKCWEHAYPGVVLVPPNSPSTLMYPKWNIDILVRFLWRSILDRLHGVPAEVLE